MTFVIRSNEVRRGNRGLVLSAVRRGALLSRTDIGARTGLSAATVSAITSDLIADGFLVQASDTNSASPGRGRPKVALSINPDAALIGVVIFQLNFVSATILDYAGTTIAENSEEFVSAELTPSEISQTLIDCLQEALTTSGVGDRKLMRIAVGVQGVTDVAATTMLWSPITAHRELKIAEWLSEEFNVPTTVSNDCDLMARALNWRDPERYGESFAGIMLSYGVGMGLFLRGSLVQGLNTSGTEFGHMVFRPGGALCRCGRRGCVEAYAGDYAISRAAAGLPEDAAPREPSEYIDFDAIIAAARKGEPAAANAIQTAGKAIGTGLVSLFALVDTFPIALIGRGTTAFDLMEKPIRETLAQNVAGGDMTEIDIDCFENEKPLVREGCAITALLVLDEEIADAIVV
ncbi:MAG: ROK family transcriptional regulator [Hyphomicrobiales bacterium]